MTDEGALVVEVREIRCPVHGDLMSETSSMGGGVPLLASVEVVRKGYIHARLRQAGGKPPKHPNCNERLLWDVGPVVNVEEAQHG